MQADVAGVQLNHAAIASVKFVAVNFVREKCETVLHGAPLVYLDACITFGNRGPLAAVENDASNQKALISKIFNFIQ